MRKTTSGFTLVELLIVIVVIAILAAISVVVYGGISKRAEATRAASVAAQAAKLIELYYVDHGVYPPATPNTGFTPGETCIGYVGNYPADGPFAAGQCLHNESDASFKLGVSDQLMAALEGYGVIPDGSIKTVKYVNEYWRGIRYIESNSAVAGPGGWLEWVVQGDYTDSCGPKTEGHYYSWLDVTHCVYGFGRYAYL